VAAQISPNNRSAQFYLAAALCFCAGGLYGWSALVPVVEGTFGGSTEQAAMYQHTGS